MTGPGSASARRNVSSSRRQVVAGHHADVGDPEVLEQLARLGERDDRLAEPARQLDGAAARRPGSARSPCRRRSCSAARRCESLISDRYLESAPTDGLIDISLSLSTISSCVWRWPMSLSASSDEARQQRGVADDDRDPLHRVADVARRGQPLGDRQARAGVPAVDHVVRRLASGAGSRRRRRSGGASRKRSRRPGQQLVRVRLVAGVPHDPVARRLEQPVQRDRDLDDAERGPEVAAGDGDGADDRLADLGRRAGPARPRTGRAGPRGPGGGRGSARPLAPACSRWRSGLDGRAHQSVMHLPDPSPVSPRRIGRRYLLSDRSTMGRRPVGRGRSGAGASASSATSPGRTSTAASAPPGRAISCWTRSSASARRRSQRRWSATARSYRAIVASSELAAGLERRDDPLQLRERVVVGERLRLRCGGGFAGRRSRLARSCSVRSSSRGADAGP